MAETETVDIETTKVTVAPESGAPAEPPVEGDAGKPPRDELGRFLASHGLPDEGEPKPASTDVTDEGKVAEGEPGKKADKAGGDEPPPEKAGEPAPFELGDLHRRMAADLDMTDEEIEALTEGDLSWLEKAARKVRRKMSALGRVQQQQGVRPDGDEAGGERKAGEDGEPETDVGKVKRILESLVETYEAEEPIVQAVQGLAAVVERLDKAEQDRSAASVDAEIDGFFDALAEEKDGDGKGLMYPQYGSGRDIAEDSPEMEARNLLVGEAEALMAGRRLMGRSCSWREALQDAHAMKNGEQRIAAEVEKRDAARRKYNRQAVPRGNSQRKIGQSEKPDALDEWQQRTGITIPD